jgi:hypothetical protein
LHVNLNFLVTEYEINDWSINKIFSNKQLEDLKLFIENVKSFHTIPNNKFKEVEEKLVTIINKRNSIIDSVEDLTTLSKNVRKLHKINSKIQELTLFTDLEKDFSLLLNKMKGAQMVTGASISSFHSINCFYCDNSTTDNIYVDSENFLTFCNDSCQQGYYKSVKILYLLSLAEC